MGVLGVLGVSIVIVILLARAELRWDGGECQTDANLRYIRVVMRLRLDRD